MTRQGRVHRRLCVARGTRLLLFRKGRDAVAELQRFTPFADRGLVNCQHLLHVNEGRKILTKCNRTLE